MKKTNHKKLITLIFILIILFIIFIYFLTAKHNYTLEYKINDAIIKETYKKDDKIYVFNINIDNKDYEVISFDKYTNQRKLIQDIKVTKEDNNTCISFISDYITLYDVCSNDFEYYYPSNEISFNSKKTYKNIIINDLNNQTFLLWNYHEFIYLNNDKQTTLKLFNKDIYNLDLIYQTKEYLLVPDYNKDYKFDKIYVINSKNNKVSEIKLRFELYFDSYFLGEHKNKVYIYDRKTEIEYYIDLKKKDIYKTSYKLLINNNFEKTTNQKLKNNKLTFTTKEQYNYYLKDNKLYGKYTKDYLIDTNVTKIVKSTNLDIYYISKDTLYYFNPTKGKKALLKYSEWEFNQNNMINIF